MTTRSDPQTSSRTFHDFVYKIRGRNAGYPAPPAQSRTCGFPASGSSVILTFAKNDAFKRISVVWLLLYNQGRSFLFNYCLLSSSRGQAENVPFQFHRFFVSHGWLNERELPLYNNCMSWYYLMIMKRKSLLTSNPYLKKLALRDKLLRRTVLTSSAVEGVGKPAARALGLEKKRISPTPVEVYAAKQPWRFSPWAGSHSPYPPALL